MYAQDGKGGSMSRTGKQHLLTRSTTFGEPTLERFTPSDHTPYFKRVSSQARGSRGPAMMLLKVLLDRNKQVELYLEAKCGLELCERVTDCTALELINMVQLKQNRL
jgi:hypothetical protein